MSVFLLNLLGFRHCLQICHFVLIIRRQVIARVVFRYCVQILNYLGFRRTARKTSLVESFDSSGEEDLAIQRLEMMKNDLTQRLANEVILLIF
ncbi:hypothetical protein Hanom_Chr04g00338571 [Helianthus anomalus]